MKTLLMLMLLSMYKAPTEPCTVWKAVQRYEFIESHNLKRVKVSCYVAPEGAHTADGSLCYEGIVASNSEHLGMDMVLYTDDLVPEALYECRDVGGHPMLQNGTAVDFYASSLEMAWDFVERHSEYVWVEWIEREDQTNDGKHQTNGQAVRPAAENPKGLHRQGTGQGGGPTFQQDQRQSGGTLGGCGMKNIDTQLTLEDMDGITEEYQAFIGKFKPKKTTDDCYTPENIYNVVLDWVCKEYNVNPANVVRPFWPGGDYERFPYTDDSVVVDNPPFSIISQIVKYYNAREIPYFLFSPYLTNFGIPASHIITPATITYQNGAEVNTAFVTNMDEYFIRSVPDLMDAIKAANDENLKESKKELPKYAYPDEVLTATAVGYMCVHHTEFKVRREDCHFIRHLECQKKMGKALFGSGFLLSRSAAAERAAAERAAATKWTLSEREQTIVDSLGKKEGKP